VKVLAAMQVKRRWGGGFAGGWGEGGGWRGGMTGRPQGCDLAGRALWRFWAVTQVRQAGGGGVGWLFQHAMCCVLILGDGSGCRVCCWLYAAPALLHPADHLPTWFRAVFLHCCLPSSHHTPIHRPPRTRSGSDLCLAICCPPPSPPPPPSSPAVQTPTDKEWFQGTADAVRQYAWLLTDTKNRSIEDVVILSGDHL
jgi:hypothetical protein